MTDRDFNLHIARQDHGGITVPISVAEFHLQPTQETARY